jgi:hypothetical protein
MAAIDEVALAALEPREGGLWGAASPMWQPYVDQQAQQQGAMQRLGKSPAYWPAEMHAAKQRGAAPPVVGENVGDPAAAMNQTLADLGAQGEPSPEQVQMINQQMGAAQGPQQMGPVIPQPRPQVQQMPQAAPNWENLIGLGMDRLIQGRLREQQKEMLPMQGGREDGYRR